MIQIISLLVIVGLALFIDPREVSITGKIIFFTLIITIAIFFVVLDIYNRISENGRNIKRSNEKMLIHKELNKINEKIAELNGIINLGKNKKGQLDPRIIIVIIIFILIYLYIKSAG